MLPYMGRKDKETKFAALFLFLTHNNDNYVKLNFNIMKRVNNLRIRFIRNEVLIELPNHYNITTKKKLEYFVENFKFSF